MGWGDKVYDYGERRKEEREGKGEKSEGKNYLSKKALLVL